MPFDKPSVLKEYILMLILEKVQELSTQRKINHGAWRERLAAKH